MEILIVITSIVFGILVGRYVIPFVGKQITVLRAEVAALHAKIDALIEALKQKL